MFGLFNGRKKARRAAIATIAQNFQTLLGGYIRFGNLTDVIQTDAYVAGYIEGRLSIFIALSVKFEGLAIEDISEVSGFVMLYLFGKHQLPVVSQAIKAHALINSPQYLDGKEKGTRVVAYAYGVEQMKNDSDYEDAIAALRLHNLNQKVAAMGFELIWFTDYMKQHYFSTSELIHFCGSSYRGLGEEDA